MEHEIVIHAWIDIVCPWCWIGAKRLEAGIALSGKAVAVEYHAFQLRADAPSSTTESMLEHLCQQQECSIEQATQHLAEISKLGAQYDIDFQWEKVQPVNSFLAHQLIYAAKASAHTPTQAAHYGTVMAEKLWNAHFSAGKNIADTDTLVELATEFGLEAGQVFESLEAGEFADAVRRDIQDAKILGIRGVPYYVIGGKLGLAGNQSPQVFVQGINQALEIMRTEPQL